MAAGTFRNQNANPAVRRKGEAQTAPAYASRNTPRTGPSIGDERSEFAPRGKPLSATPGNDLQSRGLHNDRRGYAGDFNGPSQTFSLTSHGHEHDERWSAMTHAEARPQVHDFYRNQKNTETWHEATRLAKSRTDGQFRRTQRNGDIMAQGLHGGHYANAYQENLVRVMHHKGQGIAEAAGELKPRHPQSGYGRT